MTNEILNVKAGDKITAIIGEVELSGTVTSIGEHKGKHVVDFMPTGAVYERYCYIGQITKVIAS